MISAIVAIGKNRVMGYGNGLLWHIPDDLKRFKALTMGHPVIMGRKTFESIVAMLGKPLPGRTNIVITRTSTSLSINDPNVIVVNSIEDALTKAKEIDKKEIFIIGGAQIYEQALLHVERLYLTIIDDEKEGDVFFPEYKKLFTKMNGHEHHEHNGLKYSWIDLDK
jgi:dihydrofolate reductase